MNQSPDMTPTQDSPQTPDPAASASTEQQDSASEVEILRAKLGEAEAQIQNSKEEHLRALAEIDNVRRRLERDAQVNLKYASEKLLGELLSVCDSLELGLQAAADATEGPAKALADGMQLTHRQLMSVLEKHGVKQIDPQGEAFNPDFHQAMSMIESTEMEPNRVHSVMQKGYTLHERLLRPAMVVVSKNS